MFWTTLGGAFRMELELNELQQEIQSLARRVAQEKVLPARVQKSAASVYGLCSSSVLARPRLFLPNILSPIIAPWLFLTQAET